MSQETASRPVRSHRRRRTILLIAIALILVVAISLVAISCQPSDDSGAPTVTVDRGTVALAVSASGSIAPGGRQSLGFADGGTVTQVLVNVGDQVQPGQVLARIDDTVARQTLAQRQATLDQQLATLSKLIGGNTVEAAEASLQQAQDIERATRRQIDATNASNRSATARARTQLSFDEQALERAEQQLDADRSSCAASPRTTTAAPTQAALAPTASVPTGAVPTGAVPTGPVVPTVPTGTAVPTVPTVPTGTAVPTVPTGTAVPTGISTPTGTPTPTASRVVPTTSPDRDDDHDDDHSTRGRRSLGGSFGGSARSVGKADPPDATDSGPARVVTTQVGLRAASSPLDDDDVDDDIRLSDGRTGAACSRLLSDRSAVQQAEGGVVASQTALDAAEERERTDRAAGDVSVANAQQQVVTAQNQLATASNDRPADIAGQRAQVEDARAAVAIARRDLEETVITAPAAGTVTAINGAAGEVVSPPSAVTALAPGGTAPLPATSGGTGTGTGGAAPGAGAFVTLDAADSFQVVVPFEEADAARVVPGQPVQVTVDALPNDTLNGRVVSVAPSGVDLSGIVSYYATVVVDGGADRLRDGQTAEANVRVEVVDNVLRVPAAAVRRSGGQPTVTVAGPDGDPVAVPFLAGLVGDDFVEVRSGLTDGDQVELPQATVTPNPDQGGPPPGN